MNINKKLLIVSISFLVTIAIALAIVLFTSEYKNNSIKVIDAHLLEETLLVDLNLTDKSFFLTPKFLVSNKLDDLGYIESYKVERNLPNKLTVTVQLDEVVWCSENFLIYDDSIVKLDKLNKVYCLDKPIVTNLPNFNNIILKNSSDFSRVDTNVKSLVEEIIYLDEITILLKMSDGVDVYMTIIDEKTIRSQLNNYFKYNVTNNTIDLRQKYS